MILQQEKLTFVFVLVVYSLLYRSSSLTKLELLNVIYEFYREGNLKYYKPSCFLLDLRRLPISLFLCALTYS